MTDTIKASTSADFLAAVPAITGFTARNSVVLVGFEGNLTCGAFRVDLPDRDRNTDHRACISAVLAILARMRSATGVTPVIYTDQSFEASQGIPHLEFGRTLTKRIHDSGYSLPNAFCVAVDGWASYFDADYPREGHPLAEIETSRVGSSARAARGEPIGDVSEIGKLPEPDPTFARQLDDALGLIEDGYGYEVELLLVRLSGMSDLHPLGWAELCALRKRDELPPEAWAWLIHLAQSPASRDLLMLQFAFGEAVAEIVAEENAHYLDIQRATGQLSRSSPTMAWRNC